MSKLWNRAKAMYETALFSWGKRDDDDAYVDAACFQLQQSVEFSLKFLVECSGNQYVENHDVRAQLNRLEKNAMYQQNDILCQCFASIRNMASTLNSWETETRYKDCFVALSSDVEQAFEIADTLIKQASNLIKRKQREKEDVKSF